MTAGRPTEPETLSPQSDGRTLSKTARRQAWLWGVVLMLSCLAIYAQGLRHGFLDALDDRFYSSLNPRVAAGLTWPNVVWAIYGIQEEAPTWHPLTWWSLMLDVELFGTSPTGFKATNLLLHVGSVLLCWCWLSRATGRNDLAGWVALVVAIHPLQVESVAWISERKGLLSAFFGHLGMLGYINYVQSRKRSATLNWYVLTSLALATSLLAKQMLVTFPACCVLLDCWPLRRLDWPTNRAASWRCLKVLGEKLPWMALVLVFSRVAVAGQVQGGAMGAVERYPLWLRLENVLVSYALYLRRCVLPDDLSVYYTYYREGFSVPAMAASACLLLGLTAIALGVRRRVPAVLMGWLWFLGTMFPVSGIVQLGSKQMTDRYMYWPIIGLAISAVWLIEQLVLMRTLTRRTAATIGICLAAVYGSAAIYQCSHWRSSTTLMAQAYSRRPTHPRLAVMYASALETDGRFEETLPIYARVQEVEPNEPLIQTRWAAALLALKRPAEAVEHLRAARDSSPGDLGRLEDWARVALNLGQAAEVARFLSEFRSEEPGAALIYELRGQANRQTGNLVEARASFAIAAKLAPTDAAIVRQLAKVCTDLGDTAAAIAAWQQVLTLNESPELRLGLVELLAKAGDRAGAATLLQESIRRYPGEAAFSRQAQQLELTIPVPTGR